MAAYEIAPRVYFGSAGVTYKPEQIMKFTHIVNCANIKATNTWARNGRVFLHLDCFDELDFPILDKYFQQLLDFITDALSDPDARVYIHCVMGINRSAALAVAYACHTSGLPAVDVIAATRLGTGRTLLTNDGFVAQLMSRFPAKPTQ